MKILLFLILTVSFVSAKAQYIGLYSDKESARVQFALNEIRDVLKVKGFGSVSYSNSESVNWRDDKVSIVLISLNEKVAASYIKKAGIRNAAELKEEGFIIHKTGKEQKTIYVLGYDEAGTM